jgi:hypothetical protein
MTQLYQDFANGLLSAAIDHNDTLLSSAGFAGLPVISSPDTVKLVLDPEAVGGPPEIVYVTGHSASAETVSVTRGREGTTGRAHDIQVPWVLAVTSDDLERWDLAVSDLDALELEVDGIDTRLTTAEADITTLEGTVSSHGTRLTTAEGDIDALETDVSAIDGRLTTAEGEIDALQASMVTAEADIDDLQVDVLALQAGADRGAIRYQNTSWASSGGIFGDPDVIFDQLVINSWTEVSSSDPDNYYTGSGRFTVPVGMAGWHEITYECLNGDDDPTGGLYIEDNSLSAAAYQVEFSNRVGVHGETNHISTIAHAGRYMAEGDTFFVRCHFPDSIPNPVLHRISIVRLSS